ncbi:MAG TPA: hypothetical protein VK196_02755 [Magnetospirillum sp.]|nr:hypothetical protein [Magnetospirillum sp.]
MHKGTNSGALTPDHETLHADNPPAESQQGPADEAGDDGAAPPNSKFTDEAQALAVESLNLYGMRLSERQRRAQAIGAYRAFLGSERIQQARQLMPAEPVESVDGAFDDCLFAIHSALPALYVEALEVRKVEEKHRKEVIPIHKAATEFLSTLIKAERSSSRNLCASMLDAEELQKWEIDFSGSAFDRHMRLDYFISCIENFADRLATHLDSIPDGRGGPKNHLKALIARLGTLWESTAPRRGMTFTNDPIETVPPSGPFLDFLSLLIRPLFRPEHANKTFAGLVRDARKIRKTTE